MKKKFFAIILGIISIFSLAACGKKAKGTNRSEVKLMSLSSPTESESKLMSATYGKTLASEDSLDYQYVVLTEGYNEAYYFDLKITLDNPKDYHILDFNLTCDDTSAAIYLENEYKLISDLRSINWQGSTNSEYTIKIKLNKTLDNVELNITNIFYAERESSKLTYSADLNNRGTFYVYELDIDADIQMSMVNIQDGKFYYKLEYNTERLSIPSITNERGLSLQEENDLLVRDMTDSNSGGFLLKLNLEYQLKNNLVYTKIYNKFIYPFETEYKNQTYTIINNQLIDIDNIPVKLYHKDDTIPYKEYILNDLLNISDSEYYSYNLHNGTDYALIEINGLIIRWRGATAYSVIR